MPRWALVLVGIPTFLTFFGMAAAWWTAPKHRIGWAGYGQVEFGMTEREVEEVLGVPPGSHLELPEGQTVVYVHAEAASRGRTGLAKGYSWVGNDGNLGVSFDDDGKVAGVSFTPLRRMNSTPVDELLRWLRRWAGL